MRYLKRAALLWATIGAALLVAGSATAAVPAGTVQEFTAGFSGADIGGVAAGPDGDLWFTETSIDVVGFITPAGVVTQFGLGGGDAPVGIVAGPDGNLWFTLQAGNQIGRITPAGVVTLFGPLFTGSAPLGIAVGSDANLWFTEPGHNAIGRITTAGTVTEFTTGITAAATPTGIAAGPDGNLWFTERTGNRIGRITPTGTVTQFVVTSGASQPTGIAAGPDGSIWFTEAATDTIGRISTGGVITEFAPGIAIGAAPTGIAAGPDGNLWFTEPGLDQIGRITPAGTVTEFASVAGSGPTAIAAGPDGNLWSADQTPGAIARIGSGVDVVVQPPTVYGSGRVGERALCDEGDWKASLGIGGYTYRWRLNGADLAGQTTNVFTPVAGQEGGQLTCRVIASPLGVLALYASESAAVTIANAAVGPAGATGATGGAGAAGATGLTGLAGSAAAIGATGPGGAAGARGATGPRGATGARGAAAKPVTSATLLSSGLATARGKSLTIGYRTGTRTRVVISVRRRGAKGGVRLASVMTRKAGRGSISARIALAPGTYTVVLTAVAGRNAPVVDTVPLKVSTS